MGMRVVHDIDDLANDMVAIARRVQPDMARVVRRNAERGNRIAKASAKRQSGTHGKHYPNAFTAEAVTPLVWEYGPDVSRPQGGMAFEDGPGPQTRPHNNLRKSADFIGPFFAEDVADHVGRWFW